MLRLSNEQLAQIRRAAEHAYPEECCGLLIGRAVSDADVLVTRVVESPNVNAERAHDRFEVDPKIRIDLERALRGSEERIVGHYHSHPDHPALPSETDRAMAFEPALVWLIVAVAGGRAGEVSAFTTDSPHGAFTHLEIAT